MIHQVPVQEENIVAFHVSGRLTHADYEAFLPRLEQLIRENGKLSVLLELIDFKGWDLSAAWDDFRFGTAHGDDFERIAIVGHGALQHWMAILAQPFTSASIRCFGEDQIGDAWGWLRAPAREAALDAAEPRPYRNILVGMDFSPHSVRAVRRALDLAKRHEGRVHMVHAVDVNIYFDLSDTPAMPTDFNLEKDLIEAAERRMQRMIDELGTDRLTSSVLPGSPKTVILSQAESLQADLIVMATHGHLGAARLLGSTAGAVSHRARCDVLMVRIDEAPPANAS